MRAADWIGGVGETWAREWQRTDRSFAGLEPALERAILAAAPAGPARLVDLGCGAGTTSLAIAEALPDAEVIGLDLSPDLIAVAVNRAEGLDGVRGHCRFMTGDSVDRAAALAPVDLFFSRHGVMFFDDPAAAFTGFAAAAAPGAGLVFSCFAAVADNPWATAPLGAAAPPPANAAAIPDPGPFAFADPERVGELLAATGWEAPHPPERVTFRYVAGEGEDPIAEAVAFFRRIGPVAAALRETAEADRPALLDRVAAVCARQLDQGEVAFPATAWVWTAHRQETPR